MMSCWQFWFWCVRCKWCLQQCSTSRLQWEPQLEDLRFHGFWRQAQWLAGIAWQRFLWKGGLRFLSIRILTAVCTKHIDQKFRSLGSEQPMSKHSGVLVFHMSMAFVSFAPLCCWWWVVGSFDFDVFGANGVCNNAPLAGCNGNRNLKICVFMDFDDRLSGLQALQGNDFDGKAVFVCFVHENSNSCVHQTHGSEVPKLGKRNTNVQTYRSVCLFICQWLLLVLHRFVADCELLAIVILMCSVQMMLPAMLH